MQSVIETPTFIRHAAEAGVTDEECDLMKAAIAGDPTIGDLMTGTGGLRKVRFARPGMGKSGGYRLLTFFCGEDVPIFFVDIYTKGEKANWSKAERNTFATNIAKVIEIYRTSTKKRAEEERAAAQRGHL